MIDWLVGDFFFFFLLSSGINSIVATHNNIDKFTDYTDEQNTRNTRSKDKLTAAQKAEIDFNQLLRKTGDPEVAAQEYLDICSKKGYTPKFSRFLTQDSKGRWMACEGYYKMLEDFTVYVPSMDGKSMEYHPQSAVEMKFPDNLDEIIDTALTNDNELAEKRKSAIDPIVDEVEKRLLNNQQSSESAEASKLRDAIDEDVDREEQSVRYSIVKDNIDSLLGNEAQQLSLNLDFGDKVEFPKIIINTTLHHMKTKYKDEHEKAKKGDVKSAIKLVKGLVKRDRITKFAEEYPNALVVPVIAEEMEGRNTIPYAYAALVSKIGGLKIEEGIAQANRANHTNATQIERIVRVPKFKGNVIKGQEYILVDDHTTNAGTLGALRDYIEDNGGKVVVMTTLSSSIGGNSPTLSDEQYQELKKIDYDGQLEKTLTEAGYSHGFASLSKRTANFLLDKREGRGFERRRRINAYGRGDRGSSQLEQRNTQTVNGTLGFSRVVTDVYKNGLESTLGDEEYFCSISYLTSFFWFFSFFSRFSSLFFSFFYEKRTHTTFNIFARK